jgi:hypothetical protein
VEPGGFEPPTSCMPCTIGVSWECCCVQLVVSYAPCTKAKTAGRKRFCVRAVDSSVVPCRRVRRTMYLSRKALAGYVSGYVFHGPLPLAMAQEVMLTRTYNRLQRPVRCDVGLLERAARRAGKVDRKCFQVRLAVATGSQTRPSASGPGGPRPDQHTQPRQARSAARARGGDASQSADCAGSVAGLRGPTSLARLT